MVRGLFQTMEVLSFKAFTQNAMFHLVVAVSVVFAWLACQAKSIEQGVVQDSRKLYQPYKEDYTEVSQRDGEIEEPCCFCFKRRRKQERERERGSRVSVS